MTGSAAYCWKTDRRGWLVALFVTVAAHAGIYQVFSPGTATPTQADFPPLISVSLVAAPAAIQQPAPQTVAPVEPPEPVVQAPTPKPRTKPVRPAQPVKPEQTPPRQVEDQSPPTPVPQAVASVSPPVADKPAAAELSLELPHANAAYLRNPPPVYPKRLLKRRVEGSVLVTAQVQHNGHCNQVLLKKSSGFQLFDEAALSAVREWRFIPARKGTQTVTAWVDVPIEFRITRTQ
jgi:protein TonB